MTKFQVFVSSTYLDLKDERQAAVEAILLSNNIPAGMELFSAGNESQLEIIKEWIDDSDIYMLILGGRYAIESLRKIINSDKYQLKGWIKNDPAVIRQIKNHPPADVFSYGIKITLPKFGDVLPNPVLISGTFEKEPPKGLFYCIELNPQLGTYWPKNEISCNIQTKEWQSVMGMGKGDDKDRVMVIVAVGTYGVEIINDFYLTPMHRGLVELSDDMIVVDRVRVTLKKEGELFLDIFKLKHSIVKQLPSVSKPKFQIFVSSTYDDLIEEREQVIKAILEMGHIPVGMEMFSAGDDEQWKVISKQIIDCDYYVIIAAHRYGTTTKDGISYTEKEYDFAVEKGVPVLGFVINDKDPWPAFKMDRGVNYEALLKFKEKIKTRLIKFWSTKKDLYGMVPMSLSKIFDNNPRPGWIKAEKENLSARLLEFDQVSDYSKIMNAVRDVVTGLTDNSNIQDIQYEFESVKLDYHIHKDGMVIIEQTIEFMAHEDLLFFSIWIEGDSHCQSATSIYDLNFKAETSSNRELAFTQVLDLEFKKEVAIWFTPYLPKGQKETVKITYEWNGYFNKLLTNNNDEIELFFRSKNQGFLKEVQVRFFPHGFDKNLYIKSIGAKMPDEAISDGKLSDGQNYVQFLSKHKNLANSKMLLKFSFKVD